MEVDTAIIGGGIAGLYAARELAKQNPKQKISVFEKYRILGGRMITFREGTYQWESGAGRIHSSHTMVKQLIKEYGLHEMPIGSEVAWVETYDSPIVSNSFEHSLPTWLAEVKKLPPSLLANHTLHQLLEKILGSAEKARALTIQFPYWAEIFTLRADLALQSFGDEMGTHEGYTVCMEGYDAIIGALAKDCEKRGVKIYNNYDCKAAIPDVDSGGIRLFLATGPLKLKDERKVIECVAGRAIFATHQAALKKINLFQHLPLLDLVKMEPLHRIYAVFPPSKNGSIWFEGVPRFVTSTPIRYFIPIDPKRGIVMVSYTDGKDTEVWTRISEGADPSEETLGYLVTEECRKLFPKKDIPYPIFLKSHPWKYGCSYWLPGDYDPKEASKQSLQPFGKDLPNVYVCGESFSLRQAWMEGALENTRDLLRLL